MAKDILLMLEQLRSSKIMHRDFKSQNIVVSRNHRLILIDFGSATEMRHKMAMTGRILTTPHVRAPEIVCGLHNYSYAVDVYAAGCVLWSIFTGGETMLPNLHSSVLRTRADQVKFHFGELRSVLGTEVRVTKNMRIARRFGKLYHEVRSWTPRKRMVHELFYERHRMAVSSQKTPKLDRVSTVHACSLVSKML